MNFHFHLLEEYDILKEKTRLPTEIFPCILEFLFIKIGGEIPSDGFSGLAYVMTDFEANCLARSPNVIVAKVSESKPKTIRSLLPVLLRDPKREPNEFILSPFSLSHKDVSRSLLLTRNEEQKQVVRWAVTLRLFIHVKKLPNLEFYLLPM